MVAVVLMGAFGPPESLFGNVITSYSIHYTKLYERMIVMCSVLNIRIQVDHIFYIWVGSARAIRLADKACANGDQ